MQLHELRVIQKRKNRKRVGRGGKRGTYSGRGTKGQKARAGHRIRPAERDVVQRLPKLRGTKNKAVLPKPAVLNVGDLDKFFSETVIDKNLLVSRGYLRKFSQRAKILSSGNLKKAFEIKGIEVSAKAKEKIEKAGGKVG